MTSGPLHYLSNLRTFLTVLVVFHHAAIPFGGEGAWVYASRFHQHEWSPVLMTFNVLNQTYFMATFFFLSGYFSHLSIRRKSLNAFLKEKAVRLGVPVVLYSSIAAVIQRATLQALLERYERKALLVLTKEHLANLRGVQGPVWYCALLLIFDIVFGVLHGSKPRSAQSASNGRSRQRLNVYKTPKSWDHPNGLMPNARLLIAILATVAASFLLRIIFPISNRGIFTLLNVRLGFLPQYIFFYSLGHICAGGDYMNLSDLASPRLLTILAIASLATLGGAAELVASGRASFGDVRGGLNLLAFCYAMANETIGYTVFAGLLTVFRRIQRLRRSWGGVERYAYAAFLVHVPTLVFIQAALDDWNAGAVLKTLCVGSLGVVSSWIAGFCFVHIVPGARRVL